MQFVGYQNSGKTTFVNHIIQELSGKGLKTITIKHHGHGGKPSVVEDKDSFQTIQAGAMAALVEGDGRMLIQVESIPFSLNEKIRLLSQFSPDFILIEGYKNENLDKVVFLKRYDDFQMLKDLPHVKAFFCWDQRDLTLIQRNTPLPCFQIDEEKGKRWLIDRLLSQRQSDEL